MATKQTDYIRANHIDSISPLNRYNDQQKNELNYIIQILINKDADRFQRWKSWSRLPFWVDPERDLAMTLVLAGTSMEDTDIVNWVHNNIIRRRNNTLGKHHMEYLNRRGFKIEYETLNQVNKPILRFFNNDPYSSDEETDSSDEETDYSDEETDSEEDDADSSDDEYNSSSFSNVYVGTYVYASEEDAKAHRNPLSSTITKVPNHDSDDLRAATLSRRD